jgi:hydrogenase maturation protein HypF
MTGLASPEAEEVDRVRVTVRLRLRVTGLVQGVGFRPHVHRLASALGLAGHVGNDTEGVFAEVEGAASAVQEFLGRLVADAPPAARVDGVEATRVAPTGERGFAIVESRRRGDVRTFVSPDIATCEDCLAELFDPSDRRSRYPFVNCTNCGPRFTITLRLPYDRPHTTMRDFAMCEDCASEYADPADRRFHAQPAACARCGPRLWFERGPDGASAEHIEGSDAALAAAQTALARGDVVAIKGLGGYHLACDARSDAAVERLRARKHRVEKPFAIMVRDLAGAAEVAELAPAEARLLASPQRPIVLVRRRPGAPVSPQVAPGNPRLGVLLPYAPLHHLLFAPVPAPGGKAAAATAPVPSVLVMTSGNLTDEPICFEDEEARRRLAAIADAWLLHDRPIHVPCDDSVLQVDPNTGTEIPLRRSRGYAPLPVRLPVDAGPTLAVGGELKNTFCLAAGYDAFVSQHVGDMGSLETWAAFERSVGQMSGLYGIRPGQVAADAHPGYHTRRWAEDASEGAVAEVQHHHAHIASVMAEHGMAADERVIGVAFDGTGYGTDGTIWGGEILLTGYRDFTRVAHLRTVPLPGGDAAVRRPCRVALAHLWAAGIEWSDDLPPVAAVAPTEREVLRRQLARDAGCVPTSAMGRLFDAVSSLLGLRHEVSYEAQAAMELQWAAEAMAPAEGDGSPGVPTYRFGLAGDELDPTPLLRALAADRRRGVDLSTMAAGFHAAVAHAVGDVSALQAARTGISTVALSGGVFQNVLLLTLVREELEARQLRVLTHRRLPPNDGGLALGQAAVAAARAARVAPEAGA